MQLSVSGYFYAALVAGLLVFAGLANAQFS